MHCKSPNSKQKARMCEKKRKNTVSKAMPRYGRASSEFPPGCRGAESIGSDEQRSRRSAQKDWSC